VLSGIPLSECHFSYLDCQCKEDPGGKGQKERPMQLQLGGGLEPSSSGGLGGVSVLLTQGKRDRKVEEELALEEKFQDASYHSTKRHEDQRRGRASSGDAWGD